jgi:hypothetical protein
MPGYFLMTAEQAREVIEAVGHPNLFLQMDLYHAQIMGGDLAERTRSHWPLIRHVQIAGVPGRHEPDVGEINYPYLFDLIDGPDNWRLIARAPLERGMVLGIADARTPDPDDLAVLVWAVGYAASSGRGEIRIGVAPSGSLASLEPSAARAKITRLGDLVELIEHKDETPLGLSLDPRSIDARSAALGRWEPRRRQADRGDEPAPR